MEPKEVSAVHTERYFLTAGESDASGEMPATLIAERMIEIATVHANKLGIGFATLAPMGVAWVLSRLGFVMDRVPQINEYYTITTWIESWNRLFSERCFRFADGNGNVIGYGRTVWATIDVASRGIADMSGLGRPEMLAAGNHCAMPRMRNHAPVTAPDREDSYVFRVMDLDFNRHVNSVRYIEHILNLWPLEHYDIRRVRSLEIAYRRECLSGQQVCMNVSQPQPDKSFVDLVRDGDRVVTCAIGWRTVS